jgi:hypothetical protein
MISKIRKKDFIFKHVISTTNNVFNFEVKAFHNGQYVAGAFFTHSESLLSCLQDMYEMKLPPLHKLIQLNFIERSSFGTKKNKFKGLGRNLLCHSLKILRSNGFSHIILKAVVRKKLIPFYVSIGFIQLEPIEENYLISSIDMLESKCYMEWMR